MDRSRTVEVEPALVGGDGEGDCRRRRGGLRATETGRLSWRWRLDLEVDDEEVVRRRARWW